MLKKIFFTIVMIAGAITASAQGLPIGGEGGMADGDGFAPVLKPFTLTIGPKIGANYAIAGNPEGMDIGMAGSAGFSAGIAGNVRFGRPDGRPWGTERFGVQLEVLYAMRNLTNDFKTISMNCFEVPVLFQWYFLPAFSIEAGVTFSGAFGGPKDFDAGTAIYDLGKLKAYDVMPSVGINCKLKNGFTADLRYNIGCSELAGNFKTKVSTISLGIGWLFPVIK